MRRCSWLQATTVWGKSKAPVWNRGQVSGRLPGAGAQSLGVGQRVNPALLQVADFDQIVIETPIGFPPYFGCRLSWIDALESVVVTEIQPLAWGAHRLCTVSRSPLEPPREGMDRWSRS